MPAEQLDIEIKEESGVTVIKLAGMIDALTIERLKQVIEPLCFGAEPRIVVDCAELQYVNSIGFGLFFAWHRTCRNKGGEFALAGIPEKILGIVRILGLGNALSIYSSLEEALGPVARK